MNELAASGTACEGNISDFALRIGALPDALKQLKKNLDELSARITQVKGAIQGGNENDQKKVTEVEVALPGSEPITGYKKEVEDKIMILLKS